MLKIFVLLALGAAVAQVKGQSISTDGKGNINLNTAINGNLVVKRREETTIRISDILDDVVANTKAIDKMKENAYLYTGAQQYMTSLAAETTKATVEIKVDAAKLDLAVKKLLQDMASISDSVDKKVEAAQAATDKSLTKAAADAAAAAKTAKDAAAAAAKQASADAEKSKAEIKKIVEDALKPVKAIPEDFKKASLFFMHGKYQLIDFMASPGNARGAGRIFYKVLFNPGAPGFWNHDRRELTAACTALSNDLKARDGKDRALKPACDTSNHCDGRAVALPNSYLSHYGCNSNYAINDRGYGMPLAFNAGVMMYNRQNSWNGVSMLMNRGANCDHTWIRSHDHSTNKGRSTLCTSSNSNFKVAPV